jgi:hypothetical protein
MLCCQRSIASLVPVYRETKLAHEGAQPWKSTPIRANWVIGNHAFHDIRLKISGRIESATVWHSPKGVRHHDGLFHFGWEIIDN